jgi:crotonobetainyl-CoA:carnitine CoA-transferase CaiB-like acyl-CoA transferase
VPSGEGPLAGVTVIDLSTWLAGAFAPTILAELGARVIAVEPLGGEPGRYLLGGLLAFSTSAGKESVVVDLKRAEGREIVHKLIARADVVYHNFRPGVPERLAVDYETCRQLNPAVIYMNAAAYGDRGPDASRPAFAGTMAAATGSAARQVGRGHPAADAEALDLEALKQEAWRLAKTVDGACDVNGALAAATAVLLALFDRDRTGKGQALMTTMLCSNMHANSDEAISFDSRPPPVRADNALLGFGPLYRLYEAADGWVFLACVQRKEWTAFCGALDRNDLEPRWDGAWDNSHARSLADEIAAVLRTRSADAWERLMSQHDVPLVSVELRDPGVFAVEDMDLRKRGLMVQVESKQHGPYFRHGPLHRFSRDGSRLGPAEPAGGHTMPVLLELGYSAARLGELSRLGVIEAETDA